MRSWIILLLYWLNIDLLMFKSVFCTWFYEDTKKWGEIWKSCDGEHQSPINIIDIKAVTLTTPLQLNFSKEFSSLYEVTLLNDGKVLKLKPPVDINISVSGDIIYVSGNFKLVEINFHWGIRGKGSEHKVNGESASLEIQLVFYNFKYQSIKTASLKNDGLFIISTLVDLSTSVSRNTFWRNVTNQSSLVRKPGQKTMMHLEFGNFLPKNKKDFYLYRGSLTSPPCLKTVTWLVFKERLFISEEYLNRFKALETQNRKGNLTRLSSNIRPVQPLGSRTVLKTFKCKYMLAYIT